MDTQRYAQTNKLTEVVTWEGNSGNGQMGDGGWGEKKTLPLDLFEQCKRIIHFLMVPNYHMTPHSM